MLGFDVARADLRDALRDRAFRRGLILLPAGERTLRFYPALRHRAVRHRRSAGDPAAGASRTCRRARRRRPRPGPRAPRRHARRARWTRSRCVDLDAGDVRDARAAVMAVESERYGDVSQYPPDVLTRGRRPLLQYPARRARGHARQPAGDRAWRCATAVSGRIVAYAIGSPLENHDEEGVSADPHLGEGNTFYLQAMATLPSVQNQVGDREPAAGRRARAGGCGRASSTSRRSSRRGSATRAARGSATAQVLRALDNYLGSGIRFLYAQAR